MVEVVSRVLFAIVGTILVTPLVCVLWTPYILIRSLFDHDRYLKSVARRYCQLLKDWMDWGTGFLQP